MKCIALETACRGYIDNLWAYLRICIAISYIRSSVSNRKLHHCVILLRGYGAKKRRDVVEFYFFFFFYTVVVYLISALLTMPLGKQAPIPDMSTLYSGFL